MGNILTPERTNGLIIPKNLHLDQTYYSARIPNENMTLKYEFHLSKKIDVVDGEKVENVEIIHSLNRHYLSEYIGKKKFESYHIFEIKVVSVTSEYMGSVIPKIELIFLNRQKMSDVKKIDYQLYKKEIKDIIEVNYTDSEEFREEKAYISSITGDEIHRFSVLSPIEKSVLFGDKYSHIDINDKKDITSIFMESHLFKQYIKYHEVFLKHLSLMNIISNNEIKYHNQARIVDFHSEHINNFRK